jgi:hypothetical protein
MSTHFLRNRVAPISFIQPATTYPRKRALAAFIKHLKWSIIKQLKPRKGSPCQSGKILIPESLFYYFKDYFNVTGRFKTNLNFINFLQFSNKIFVNEKNYCYFDKKLMRVRIGRTRNIRYLDEDLVKKEINSGYFLFTYQFNRIDEVC